MSQSVGGSSYYVFFLLVIRHAVMACVEGKDTGPSVYFQQRD